MDYVRSVDGPAAGSRQQQAAGAAERAAGSRGSSAAGAAGSRQQAAAGSSRQQQAAAGSSRQQQQAAGSSRQQQAAAGSSSKQSEWMEARRGKKRRSETGVALSSGYLQQLSNHDYYMHAVYVITGMVFVFDSAKFWDYIEYTMSYERQSARLRRICAV